MIKLEKATEIEHNILSIPTGASNSGVPTGRLEPRTSRLEVSTTGILSKKI